MEIPYDKKQYKHNIGKSRMIQSELHVHEIVTIDLYNTGWRIKLHLVKPTEISNLEYEDGRQLPFRTCM